MPLHAFVDASVLFAAAHSTTGAAHELMLWAARGELRLTVSDVVLQEVHRNLALKSPKALPGFELLLFAVPFETVQVTSEEIALAAAYTELKDAPIVAAALKCRADYLLSFDRAHLVDQPAVAAGSGLRIILPSALLQLLRV